MSETISGGIFISQRRSTNRRSPELRPQDANLMNLLIQENMNHNLSNGNGDDDEVNQTNNIHALALLRDITRDLLSVNQRFHTPEGIFQGLFGPFGGMGGMGGLNIQEILERSLSDMGGVHKYVSDDVIKELKEPIGDERLDGNGEIATCSICMESIGSEPVEDAPSVILPCKHHFHKECILPWFKENNKCPDCRQEMPFEEKSSRPVEQPAATNADADAENTHDDEDDQYQQAIETLLSQFRNTRVPHNINYTVREITPNMYSMEVRNSTLRRMMRGPLGGLRPPMTMLGDPLGGLSPPMTMLGGPLGGISPPMTMLGDPLGGISPPMTMLGGPLGGISPPMTMLGGPRGGLSPPMTMLGGPRGGLSPPDQEQYELDLAIRRSLEDLSGSDES